MSDSIPHSAGPREPAGASTSQRSPAMIPQWRTAAVVFDRGDNVDAILATAVDALGRAGRTVGGLLQNFGAPIGPGKREMLLRVLPGTDMIPLNDPRGPGVQGCILDTGALARASVRFRQAAQARPDLLLANRFGKEEAAGGGLRADLAEALLAGIPLLVPVSAELLPAWHAFLGAPAEVLPPDVNAILAWSGFRGGRYAIAAEHWASTATGW
jgi:Protein of unknown function (DUF2478)